MTTTIDAMKLALTRLESPLDAYLDMEARLALREAIKGEESQSGLSPAWLEHFNEKRLSVYANKHPALLVRQLAQLVIDQRSTMPSPKNERESYGGSHANFAKNIRLGNLERDDSCVDEEIADYGHDNSVPCGYNTPYYCGVCGGHVGDVGSPKEVPLKKDSRCYACEEKEEQSVEPAACLLVTAVEGGLLGYEVVLSNGMWDVTDVGEHPLFTHPAPAIKEVVINADYRKMWEEQVRMNQRLCSQLAAPEPTEDHSVLIDLISFINEQSILPNSIGNKLLFKVVADKLIALTEEVAVYEKSYGELSSAYLGATNREKHTRATLHKVMSHITAHVPMTEPEIIDMAQIDCQIELSTDDIKEAAQIESIVTLVRAVETRYGIGVKL